MAHRWADAPSTSTKLGPRPNAVAEAAAVVDAIAEIAAPAAAVVVDGATATRENSPRNFALYRPSGRSLKGKVYPAHHAAESGLPPCGPAPCALVTFPEAFGPRFCRRC